MGIALKCVLEHDLPGAPRMDGKNLFIAYMGEIAAADEDELAPADETPAAADATNIVTVDFGRAGPPSRASGRVSRATLRELDPFIQGDAGVQWHDPSQGLIAVRHVLEELRAEDAKVSGPPDFGFEDEDEDDLKAGVIADLEELEDMLIHSEAAHSGFCLVFDA